MTSQKTYVEACNDFDKIYNEAIKSREPVVVSREGGESVSVIPTSELNNIIETAYLFQSPENAARLLDALQRVKAKTNEPQTIEELRKEFNLYEED
ncbi:type II toxin-antitoxin system Phd/YefM family antitoxin [Iningainema tapete]|uniref:Antitoxin n=1 Tax=Iningainema tapete BLCC-T55 TaxID=2748662 RepID=A0A8J6XSG4_9CYAN|nr:type II toxin-antitoxin system Phd/YefM family antitoxin [Iningainema tapete]MBD2772813.1 type II toxin-antitoxin system Phd/YefM family antitoxin [Iningainema tapete BLCC-T55]